MASAGDSFFEGLKDRRDDPILRGCTGTLRFDIQRGKNTEHWYVDMKKGDATVTRRDDEADCWINCEAELFDKISCGEVNAMAALLRGAFTVGGNLDLLMTFWRLLPGPPNQQAPKPKQAVAGGR